MTGHNTARLDEFVRTADPAKLHDAVAEELGHLRAMPLEPAAKWIEVSTDGTTERLTAMTRANTIYVSRPLGTARAEEPGKS